jgi:hypothetical protein
VVVSRPGTTAAVIEAVCSDWVVVCGDLRLIEAARARPAVISHVDASRALARRIGCSFDAAAPSVALEVTAGRCRPRDLVDRRVGGGFTTPAAPRSATDRRAHVVASSAPPIVAVDREEDARSPPAPRRSRRRPAINGARRCADLDRRLDRDRYAAAWRAPLFSTYGGPIGSLTTGSRRA